LESVLEWLQSLPLGALYTSMACLAIVENIFPPIPADTIVALGSFLAAKGQGSATVAFLVVWIGNLIGATIMYWVGRHLGARWTEGWFGFGPPGARQEHKLTTLYEKYGLAALALSRFMPGVRALVPPFAGAMRLPPLSVFLVMALPSGVWYGVVTIVAFQMGTRFDLALDSIKSAQNWTTVIAGILLAGLVILWLLARRKRVRP
jgi:LPXTG-motif cell wall-anchored protein